jgi:putative transposase
MPRPPRAFVEGIYHISSHGSDARRLFLGDGDRATFVARLGVILERFELRLVAYTLLGNHYHLVLVIPDARVSKAFQQLHTWYSRWHNLIHGRSAHLFCAHFFARELTSDGDLLTVCRYLAYNSVLAGLSRDPFSWRWSSTAATAGLARPMLALDPAPLRSAFGETADWSSRYRAFIESWTGAR